MMITGFVMAVLMAASTAGAAPGDRLPPEPGDAPSIHDLRGGQPPAIFTYRVDEQCRVTGVRQLQGPDDLLWRDVNRARRISAEDTVFRMVEGQRRQLTERRVRLLGEMVLPGELVCLVQPIGGVVDAWIMRTDTSPARRRAPTRESVPVRDGDIGELGTFSVTLELPLPD